MRHFNAIVPIACLLRRIDNVGRQVARVKLPKAQVIEKHTDVVVSSLETRLLVVHSGSTNRYPPGHLVMILDAMSLKRVAEFPLGDCGLVDVSARPDDVTLLCHQSQDPANKKGKKTFALVTLDLNRATLVGWFSLGGERRGQWVGPMFFGYYDDEWPVSVGTGGCSAFTNGALFRVEGVTVETS
jgi:hypothetical protein